MGKIYNINLNSINSTVGSLNSNANYVIDWANLLPSNKAFKLTFTFQASINAVNNFRFPYVTTNILGYSFANANGATGFNNSYILGTLRLNTIFGNYGNYIANIHDNPAIYLDSRPTNPLLNIKILDNLSKNEFVDSFFTATGSGTATQSGFILTIATATAGLITLGTEITISGVKRTVLAFGTGTSGVGTYIVNVSSTISTATAYTFAQDLDGNTISPYILTLSFEEIDK